MAAKLSKPFRSGLLFGGILLFLGLLGFTTTVTGVFLPTIVLGIWCGAAAIRPPTAKERTWGLVLSRSLAAGIGAGLIMAVFAYLIATARAAHFDLRGELYQLSPDAIRELTFNQAPVIGALANLGLLAGLSVAGGVLFQVIEGLGLDTSTAAWLNQARSSVGSSGPWAWTSQTTPGKILAGAVLIGVVFVVPRLIPGTLSYYTESSVLIYVLMALGLNIVVGLAGLLDLGYVVFFAIGAYSMALLTAPKPYDLLWPFWVVLPIGVVLAASVGVLLGIPVLRLRGDYLAIVTLGFGEVIHTLLISDALTSFDKGPNGVPAIGQPEVFGRLLNSPEWFVVLAGIGAAIVIFLTGRLQNSRVGRAWIAIREDETVARAMGINTLFYKLLAFGIGASFAGIGGLLYASRNQFTGPEDHTLLVSINILAIVIVGGMGSIPGVILGAFVLKGIPEILRDLQTYRIILFAALLIVMMILRPQGLWPSARRRLEMHIEEESPIDELQPATSKGVAK